MTKQREDELLQKSIEARAAELEHLEGRLRRLRPRLRDVQALDGEIQGLQEFDRQRRIS